ncbi:MAG: sigma-70 family RNA polymerase sigma factor [Deltaproteobacteria bacterium]|nr:sigma-70 family RNA polymerase sigma factor [Deltaproteobacteria bacterium]
MPVKEPDHKMYAAADRDAGIGPLTLTRDERVADEATLVDAVRRGAPGSREALYHRYKRRVFALAARIAGPNEAEEVAQEAFIRIFRGLARFRGDSALGTWIYRLAVNAALSHRSRRPPPTESLDARTAEASALVSSTLGPDDGDAVLRARLERGLARLPVGYRTVVVLHDVEGLEHEEIAAVLGCHVGTSKSQLHKARGRLREILAADGITAADVTGKHAGSDKEGLA